MSIFDKLFNNYDFELVTGLTKELKCINIFNQYKNNDNSILIVESSLYEANLMYQFLQNYTDNVFLFPMDDFLTSEALAISPELKITRLETLNNLSKNKKIIVITNLMGYLRFLPPKKVYIEKIIKLSKNQEYSVSDLIEKLYSIGYTREVIVNKTGEIAIRGFVLDIYPINKQNPVRIEFWGDTIDSIRIFDIDTQLTIEEINDIEITPNSEFLVNKNLDNYAIKQKNLIKYGEVDSLVNYFDKVIVIFDNYKQIKNSYELLKKDIFNYNIDLKNDVQTKYMHDLDDIKPLNIKYIEDFDEEINCVKNTKNYISYEIEPFNKNLADLKKILNKYIKDNFTIIICVSNRYQINKIEDNLSLNFIITNENEIFDNKINIIIKNINKGFIFNNYIFISETELFNRKVEYINYKSNFKIGKKIRDINKLNIGDYIVHNIHGIGKYIGLKTLTKNNLKKDYLTLEYRGGDKLYIPVEKMELISKYSSNEGIVPKINKLGTSEWEKIKYKTRKRIEDIASKLLALYAKRETSKGFAFVNDNEQELEFIKDFKHQDTIDQMKVTEEIKKDMESSKPMDRLLCGDVGYGITEVAFRAMFKAVLSGKQVAFLCPTTILSNQHYNNAIDRFKNFAVNIVLLNRFVSHKDLQKIKSELKEGKVDIVIGTHRILSDDIEFKDLGLLVIDEEQRFGVKHKEKIKSYKNNIDVLTLSATPIPRTLQMSMSGIRNLSLIETPPVNRYPVQTYVLEENNNIIKDAIYKELSRNGQVFILYNNISDMDNKLEEMKRLIPDAKIVIAHGKMTKNELENIMLKFINKEYDILLCTTIIETGIDIPNVNTLIIIDADRFGLSQLYQIRGRVGRSNKIAYCYLMYNKGKILSDVAMKRLSAIREFTELGSGFSIAMRDLSIRGAGDILGSEQAGYIDTIGIELYLKMLEEEVNKLKGIENVEKIEKEQPVIEVSTSIDDSYIPDEEMKIEIHKKINTIDSYDKLIEVKKELEDRFGHLNENIIIYMHEEWFEKLIKKFDINNIRQTNNFIEITLSKDLTNKINGELLFIETSKLTNKFRFALKREQLIVTLDLINLDKHFIYYLIEFIQVLDKIL